MVRLGVSLPALMKMLGHKNIRMTMRYVKVTQIDLQREFLDRWNPEGNCTDDDRDRAALLEAVDPEASDTGYRVGQLDLVLVPELGQSLRI